MKDHLFSPFRLLFIVFAVLLPFFLRAQSAVDTIPPADSAFQRQTRGSLLGKKIRNPLQIPVFKRQQTAASPTTTIAGIKTYEPEEAVMLHPPALPCLIDVETRDEFSGELYRRTAAAELFRHTPKVLKNYLKGAPNVLCEASLAASGSKVYLYLTFTINDPNPRKAFGKLEKNSLATLRFMDGSSFDVFNQQLEEETTATREKALVFHALYPLSVDVLKIMKHSYLDRVRIDWSSGYEDYDVQDVRLLEQQLRCLFN